MKDKFSLNLFSSVFTFSISMLIAIWITPFVINNLGPEAYGFIPLTQTFITSLSIITVAMSSIISMYMTISLKEKKYSEANIYYNTYLLSATVFSACLIFIIYIFTTSIEKIFVIPQNLIKDVQWAIFFSGVLFILTFVGAVFSSASFVTNKLYLLKSVELIEIIVRTSLLILFFGFLTPEIWYYNLSLLVGGIFAFVLHIIIFYKLLPFLTLNLKYFEFTYLRKMLSSGMWNSINQIGVVLFLGIDLFIANIMLGPGKAGIYAAILQIPLIIRTLAGIISSLFAPNIISYYAKNEYKLLNNYLKKSVKIVGVILALPIALVCSLADSILLVWLGNEFKDFSVLLSLNSFYLIIVLSMMPLNHLFLAMNKLKVPAVTTIFLSIINIILAITIIKFSNLGLYGIFIASFITLFVKNLIFTPIYSSKLIKVSISQFYKCLLIPMICFIITYSIGKFVVNIIQIDKLYELLLVGGTIVLFYFLIIILFLIKRKIKWL